MGAMVSQITSLTIVTQLFIQAQIKENIKDPRHGPLCGEFTGEFSAQMASNAENVSIWWRHHDTCQNMAEVRDTKPIVSVPLFSEFFSIIKAHVNYWISRLYLTGVAAVQL